MNKTTNADHMISKFSKTERFKMNYMTNKIVAIQGNNPSKLNPTTDTSVFLAHEIQTKTIKYFIMIPKIYPLLILK